MSYHTVLGYRDNTLLDQYKEKYFIYLYNQVLNFFHKSAWLIDFKALDKSVLREFLLHPDNSSLIQEIWLSWDTDSRDRFEIECSNIISWENEKLTALLGDTIPGTEIKLTLYDNNPQNMQVWHPDHDQNGMLGWGDRAESEWLRVFSDSFTLLKHIDEDFFLEMNSMIQKIVPMRTSVDVHNSCSYKECIGTLYLWYTINAQQPELSILEALIHESSHNKLNLIMQSEKLHINDYSLRYYSPYRPDARHIQWVLLWVHAIVPTVYILLLGIEKWHIRNNNWYEKVLLYHMKNKLGYRVLERHGKFTTIWKKIFDDMWDVMKLCDVLIKNNSHLQAIDFSSIQARAKEHFIEVRNNYPYLQY